MKSISVLFLFSILASCKKSGYSDADFSGKTFAAHVKPDSLRHNKETVDLLATAQISFEFNDRGLGYYRVKFQGKTDDQPFDWNVRADTLVINNKAESKVYRYAIRETAEGLLINDGQMPFVLTKK